MWNTERSKHPPLAPAAPLAEAFGIVILPPAVAPAPPPRLPLRALLARGAA